MKLPYFVALASAALIESLTGAALAAPAAVSVDFTALRCIQEYNIGEGAGDQTFVLVNGIAGGKEFQAHHPGPGQAWASAKKTIPVSDQNPFALWNGTLNDGEFVIIAVSVFQGAGKDETLLKKYQDAIVAAGKMAPAYEKKTLTLADFVGLTIDAAAKVIKQGDLVQNQRKVIVKIKDSFSREKKTDHYGGLFDIVVWNDGAKVRKRVLPVGLTFGEHYGKETVKIYTKLKQTRANMFVKDEDGTWSDNNRYLPLSENEKTVHVKMLETEELRGDDGIPFPKTTDYVAGVTVTVNNLLLKWRLDGQVNGEGANDDDIHRFWEVAE